MLEQKKKLLDRLLERLAGISHINNLHRQTSIVKAYMSVILSRYSGRAHGVLLGGTHSVHGVLVGWM
jgi:hypothetical protein